MLDPIDDLTTRKNRRSIGRSVRRFFTALAIGMVAVPLVLSVIYPVERLPAVSRCGDTIENYTLFLGLAFLGAQLAWKILKRLNDFIDPFLPNHSPQPKPQPLDDF